MLSCRKIVAGVCNSPPKYETATKIELVQKNVFSKYFEYYPEEHLKFTEKMAVKLIRGVTDI
jgi:hypothetical protein